LKYTDKKGQIIILHILMKKNWIVVGLSLWIIIVLFLGFPSAWKTFFIVVSGFLIGSISFLEIVRQRAKEGRVTGQQSTVSGADNVSS